MRGSAFARQTYPTHRDVTTWPFATNSIWNMPIGSGAVYQQFHSTISTAAGTAGENPTPGITPNGIVLTGSPSIPDTSRYPQDVSGSVDINWVVYAKASDPLRTVYHRDTFGVGRCTGTTLEFPYSGGPTPWQINLPDNFIVPDANGGTPNFSAAIIQPDSSIQHFNVVCRNAAGANNFHATPFWRFGGSPTGFAADSNVYSTGVYGGHGGSGLSAYGGALLVGDLTGSAPIHHALSIEVYGAEFLYYDSGTGIGYVWPAITNDGGASNVDYYNGYHGHYPAVRMGSLLAIPPSVTEASTGITLRPVKKLFHALQDYGAYIVDNTGASSVNLNIENSAYNEFYNVYGYNLYAGKPGYAGYQPLLHDELLAVYGKLQVVANNGPSSIGGGGTPRVPLAPSLT